LKSQPFFNYIGFFCFSISIGEKKENPGEKAGVRRLYLRINLLDQSHLAGNGLIAGSETIEINPAA
jgi:hypothetical protein